MINLSREELLGAISEAVQKRVLSPSDLEGILETLKETAPRKELTASVFALIRQRFSLTNVFYWIGGFIVLLAVSFLFALNWTLLPSAARVLATLGSGIIFLLMGIILKDILPFRVLASVFMFLSVALIPGGVYVIIGEFTPESFYNLGLQTNIFLGLLIAYFLLYWFLKSGVLGFGATIFGAAAGGFAIAYATEKMASVLSAYPLIRMVLLLTMGLGLVFVLVGYLKQKKNAHPAVYEFFYFSGLATIFSGTIGLLTTVESLPLFYFFQSLYFIIPLLLVVAGERWNLTSVKALSLIYWIAIVLCSPLSRWSLFSIGNWQQDFMPWRIALIAALILAFVAIVFVSGRRRGVYPFFLNNVSALTVLGALVNIAFSKAPEAIPLLLLSPVLIFLVYYLAVQLNFKSYLVWNTVYLISLLFHVGNRFFPQSTFTFPVLMLVSGVIIIFAGYLFFRMRR